MERLTDHSMDDYNEPGCNLCTDYAWRLCKQYGNMNVCQLRAIYNRLEAYEDSGLTPERVQVLAEADREGRLIVLKGEHVPSDGEEALRKAMYTVVVTNNAANRYIADAVAEKLVRDDATMKADTKEGL